MNLHWMSVYDDVQQDYLKHLFNKINECKYYSILFVYHSKLEDYWLLSARYLDKQHKFKYMFAIRTYSISPEYFSMKYKSFEQIDKNRIMFNIISGDIQDSEDSLDNLVMIKDFLDTSEQRISYTYEWMKKLKKIIPENEMPEIVMSGTSEKTLNYAAELADYNLCMMDNFLDDTEKFLNSKKRMVCAAIIIRDTYEEAENVANNLMFPHHKNWTIFGTEDHVLRKIKEIKYLGATDLMIRRHLNDTEYERIHDFVKKNGGQIL